MPGLGRSYGSRRSTRRTRLPDRATRTHERDLADCVDDDVVAVAVLREIIALLVVEHFIRAERTDEIDVLSSSHSRDVRTHRFRELHGCRSDRTRRTVDQDVSVGDDAGATEARER